MITPTAFNAPNLTLTCSTCGWSGSTTISSLTFATTMTGTEDRNFINLFCGNPACGSVSTHPVGGGASPRVIQALFIIKLMQDQGLTFTQAKSAVKTAAEDMDFVGRFQLGDVMKVGDLQITA